MTNDSDPVLTLKQAAEAAGVSVSTLRRKREALAKAGATISSEGWQVPLSALIEAGLMTASSRPRGGSDCADEAVSMKPLVSPDVEALKAELAEWKNRALVAEAVAEERGRALADMRETMQVERMALRMLAPATETPETGVSDSGYQGSQMNLPSPSTETPAPARRGLFGRLFS